MTIIPPHVSFLSHFKGVQILVSQPDKEKGGVWHHNASRNLSALFKRNRDYCGVFFTINALDKKLAPGHRRTKEMLTHIRALYADDDIPRPSPRTDFALPPSLIVQTSKSASGYKYHYYWLLNEPLACSYDDVTAIEYEQMLKGVANTYQTDSSSTQVNRILRIPGFYHHKKEPQMIETIVDESTGRTYSWNELRVAFPPLMEDSSIYNDSLHKPSGGDWKKHLNSIWKKQGAEAWPHYSAAAMSLANDLCDQSVAMELISGEVLQAFKDNGRPIEKWRMENIKDSVDSAYKKVERERAGPLEDPTPFKSLHLAEPFPIELLPSIVQSAVREYARFIQVSPDSICASALSAMATVMGNKVAVIERPGLEHYPSMGFIIAAGSGERKSPVFKHLFAPVRDIEKELVERWKKERSKNAIKASVLAKRIKAELKKLEDDAEEDENEEDVEHIAALQEKLSAMLPKACPQLYGMDITEETLGKVLSEQDGEFALLSAEARGIIDNITGKYSQGDKTGDSIILSAMTGDEIRNARGGNSDAENRSSYIINNACLNLCLFIQPDKAIELMSHPKLADSGLLARTIILSPRSTIGTRMIEKDDKGIDIHKTQDYQRAVYKVGIACSISKRKIKMTLSPEAQEMHRLFANETELRFANDLADSIHLCNKMVSTAAKISAILTGMARGDAFTNAIEFGNKEALSNRLLEGQPIIFEIDAEVYGYAIRIVQYMIELVCSSHQEMTQNQLTTLTKDYLIWVRDSKHRDKILARPFKGKGSMLASWASSRYNGRLLEIYHTMVLNNWASIDRDGIWIRKDFTNHVRALEKNTDYLPD